MATFQAGLLYLQSLVAPKRYEVSWSLTWGVGKCVLLECVEGVVLTLKLVFLWVPALTAWAAVVGNSVKTTCKIRRRGLESLDEVSGVTLDFRTPEEIKQEEQEAQLGYSAAWIWKNPDISRPFFGGKMCIYDCVCIYDYVCVPLYFHDLRNVYYVRMCMQTEGEREKERVKCSEARDLVPLVRQAQRLERFFDVEHLPEARTTGCSFIKLSDSGSLINRKLLAWYFVAKVKWWLLLHTFEHLRLNSQQNGPQKSRLEYKSININKSFGGDCSWLERL